MMKRLKLYILKSVLSPERKCPPTLSRGEGKWWDTNCFSVRVKKNGQWYLLLESINGNRVKAKEWDGKRYSTEVEVGIDDFEDHDLLITHRYGPFDINYRNYSQYMLGGWTKYQVVKNRIWLFFHNLRQQIFNIKRLAHAERIDLLNELITFHIHSNGESFNYMKAMELIYSSKWILHPKADRQEIYIKLLLESLVSSGELSRTGNGYKITGKAVATLSDYQLEQRKHKENVNLRIVMIILTFGMILIGFLQALTSKT